MKTRAVVIETISFLFVLLFIYTASSKWLNLTKFIGQMNNQPFDAKYTPILVWGVPSIEIIIAILLMFNRTKLLGLCTATFLMAVFTGYVALVLSNFYGVLPCSCGGVIETLSWPQHLAFNTFFVLIGLIGILLEWRRKKYTQHIAVYS